jgi:hypothetical protein
LVRVGGRIEKDAHGEEAFVIPVKAPTPNKFEDLKNPGPIAGSVFSDAEMAKIASPGLRWAARLLEGWTLSNCNLDQSMMLWESKGRKNVFVLNALTRGAKTYVLAKTLAVPAGKPATLEFVAACEVKTDGWKINLRADGKDLTSVTVNRTTMTDGWTPIRVSLPDNAGKPSAVEIIMEPVTPPPERRNPPALSLTLPTLVDR